MPRLPGHGNIGDGEVPLQSLQAIMATLVEWHLHGKDGVQRAVSQACTLVLVFFL